MKLWALRLRRPDMGLATIPLITTPTTDVRDVPVSRGRRGRSRRTIRGSGPLQRRRANWWHCGTAGSIRWGASARELKGRTLTNLYNARPTWLDLAHRRLDAAVLAAYGWPADLGGEALLERLLALNLARGG